MLLLCTYDHFTMQQCFLLYYRLFYYCDPLLFHLIFGYASFVFVFVIYFDYQFLL